MSKPQHTPGPWLDDDSGEWVTTARVIRRNGIVVCHLKEAHPMTREEADANARLITKAPEMAEDWREVQDIIDNSWLSEAGRYRQIEEIFNRRQRALLAAIDGKGDSHA